MQGTLRACGEVYVSLGAKIYVVQHYVIGLGLAWEVTCLWPIMPAAGRSPGPSQQEAQGEEAAEAAGLGRLVYLWAALLVDLLFGCACYAWLAFSRLDYGAESRRAKERLRLAGSGGEAA